MITNKKALHKRTDTEINNYRSLYGIYNEQSPYRIVSYKEIKKCLLPKQR